MATDVNLLHEKGRLPYDLQFSRDIYSRYEIHWDKYKNHNPISFIFSVYEFMPTRNNDTIN